MEHHVIWTVVIASLTVACGSDDEKGQPASPMEDSGTVVDSGVDRGAPPMMDAGPDVALPQTPWGPSFVGIAENLDGTTPDDLALGYFWDAAVLSVDHVGPECVGFRTPNDAVAGLDVGEVTVTGGGVVDPAPLERDANGGHYYLSSPDDVWNPGDMLSLTARGQTLGPVEVPTELASETLSTQTTVNRDGPLPIVFSGTNARQIAVSLGGGDGTDTYLLICLADAASGQYAVPAEAMGSIPAGITNANIKLSPVNSVSQGDLTFFAAGRAAEVDAAIAQ